jgi:RNA recognition motif-containing protein
MKLFVGNLSFQTTQDELLQAFSAYGTVDSASILTDRDTGQSRGFGFVEMPNRKQAQDAMTALNGTQLNGRTLNVNEARPKPEGGFGGGGGGHKQRRAPRW